MDISITCIQYLSQSRLTFQPYHSQVLLSPQCECRKVTLYAVTNCKKNFDHLSNTTLMLTERGQEMKYNEIINS